MIAAGSKPVILVFNTASGGALPAPEAGVLLALKVQAQQNIGAAPAMESDWTMCFLTGRE